MQKRRNLKADQLGSNTNAVKYLPRCHHWRHGHMV